MGFAQLGDQMSVVLKSQKKGTISQIQKGIVRRFATIKLWIKYREENG
jgi:hypothetical protein